MTDTDAARWRRAISAVLDVMFRLAMLPMTYVAAALAHSASDEILAQSAIACCLTTGVFVLGAAMHGAYKIGVGKTLIAFAKIEPTENRSLQEAHDLVRFGEGNAFPSKWLTRWLRYLYGASLFLSLLFVFASH